MTTRRRALVALAWLAAPVACGLASLAIGQDANWDLRNYHLYNPWALLTGRIGLDVAPAETPTYFNPLLDVPYAVLADHLPARLLAFLLGAFHGLALVALYRIGVVVLGPGSRRVAAVLALVAAADNTFTSELGNTMGDDTTAVLMLTALALALPTLRETVTARVVRGLGWAGLVAGLGVGLKLTNAPYALALAVAACVASSAWPRRARLVPLATLAAGLVAGFATTSGYWLWTMWSRYGNPFHPQFNGLFGSPFAAATMVVDDRFRPSGWLEALAFPFVFTMLPIRIYEIPLVNPLWPVAYALFVATLVRALVQAGRSMSARDPAQRFLLVFAGVGYLAWLAVFAIGRYLVTIDLLLPLVTWLLVHRWCDARVARRVAGGLLVLMLIPLAFNARTWGSADFANTAYRVVPPPIDDPSHATILVMTAPVAWMFPRFPAAVAYVSFNGSFPESRAHLRGIGTLIEARGGPVYAIVAADDADDGADDSGTQRGRLNRLLATWDIRRDDLACRYVIAIFAHSPSNDIRFDDTPDPAGATPCRVRRDPARRTGIFRDAAATIAGLAGTGLAIDLARCTAQRAWIGAAPFDYRFCRVERAAVGVHLERAE